MGKTADLTVVQKTIIDTVHKEGKPQTFIAKEAGCSQSAVSKHVNRKLSGRKKCGRKSCTTNRENRRLMRIVKQNRFKNLGELHKEWTEAGVKASGATTHRRVKEFGYSCHQRRLTWAKEKKNWTVAQRSKILFSDENLIHVLLLLIFIVGLGFFFLLISMNIQINTISFIYFLLQNVLLFLTPHPQWPIFVLGCTPGGAAASSAPLLPVVMPIAVLI